MTVHHFRVFDALFSCFADKLITEVDCLLLLIMRRFARIIQTGSEEPCYCFALNLAHFFYFCTFSSCT